MTPLQNKWELRRFKYRFYGGNRSGHHTTELNMYVFDIKGIDTFIFAISV